MNLLPPYGVIYKITNDINTKVYVGQTIRTLAVRFRGHCSLKRSSENSAIRGAIHAYGKDHFKIEQIDTASDLDDLNRKEIYWIGMLNCLCPNGYNLSLGGNGGGKMHESTKRKLSLLQKGTKKIQFWSEETRRSQGIRSRWVHMGRRATQETREKMSLAKKGRTTTWTCIPVKCVETGVIYQSSRAAIKATGMSGRNFFRLLHGGFKSPKYGLSFVKVNNPTVEAASL